MVALLGDFGIDSRVGVLEEDVGDRVLVLFHPLRRSPHEHTIACEGEGRRTLPTRSVESGLRTAVQRSVEEASGLSANCLVRFLTASVRLD